MKKLATATMICLALAFAANSTATEAGSAFEARKHEDHLCARGSAWYAAKSMSIEVSAPQTETTASYQIQTYDNGDIRMTLKDPNITKDGTAEAMVVGGHALITKNIKTDENNAIDILDLVALQQQLVLALINLADEKGPEGANLPIHKEMSEQTYPIKATTASASALFAAPWKATVDLQRKDKGTITYKIRFNFTSEENKKTEAQMAGSLSKYGKGDRNPIIPDDFAITDWKQYDIGPYRKETGSGTIMDFGTTYIEKPLSTIGQLREHIHARDK